MSTRIRTDAKDWPLRGEGRKVTGKSKSSGKGAAGAQDDREEASAVDATPEAAEGDIGTPDESDVAEREGVAVTEEDATADDDAEPGATPGGASSVDATRDPDDETGTPDEDELSERDGVAATAADDDETPGDVTDGNGNGETDDVYLGDDFAGDDPSALGTHEEDVIVADDEATDPDRDETATIEAFGDAPPAGIVPGSGHDGAQPATTGRRGGFVPLLLGGVLAGLLGFGAAWLLLGAGGDAGLAERGELAARLSEIESRLESLGGAEPVDLGPLETRQNELDARGQQVATDLQAMRDENAAAVSRIDEIAARIDEMTGRVEELEARPIYEAGDTRAAMETQLQAFRDTVASAADEVRAELAALREEAARMRDEAERMQAEAEAAMSDADRRSALAAVAAALESGEPYADAVARLEDPGEALTAPADTGVPTLASLQESFAPAARAALAAAPVEAEADAGAVDRVAAFLARHTNARSLAPQEGENVNATLSRAEAALNAGDLETALAELETLPQEARDAMADWIGAARTRQQAVSALNDLEGA